MSENDILGIETISQAPLRVSLAGGGTDIAPYPEKFGGAVVSATISMFMSARLRIRNDSKVLIKANTRHDPIEYPDVRKLEFDGKLDFVKAIVRSMYKSEKGFELFLYSSVPMRSGLGGSGAMCVAIMGAFNHLLGTKRLNSYDIAELAYKIEVDDLKNLSGRQDQYAAAFGGINYFEFFGDKHVRANPIEIHAGIRHFSQALILMWLCERSTSGHIIEDQKNAIANGKGKILDAMHVTKKYTQQMYEAIQTADIHQVGRLLDTLWELKKKFSKYVSNPHIDEVYEKLRNAGMIGGKITGAGGGGHMLACCDIENRDRVQIAAEEMGIRIVPFTFVGEGLLTWQAPVREVE